MKKTKKNLKVNEPEDGLRVHEIPEKKTSPLLEPEPGPEPEPETEPEPEPELEPEPEPEPKEETEKKTEGEEIPPVSVEDSFKDLEEKIKTAEPPKSKKKIQKPLIEKTRKKKRKGESSPDSFRIEGYILLLITDTVFPFALSGINNLLDKRIKIQAHQLALNEKDFEKLEPLADQAADYMNINLNPIAGFALMAVFMYGNNLLNVRMELTANANLKK